MGLSSSTNTLSLLRTVVWRGVALQALYRLVRYVSAMCVCKHRKIVAPRNFKFSFGVGEGADGPSHGETYFLNKQGLRIETRSWLPLSKALGLVVISHGFGEHGGRYGRVARALADEGFIVCALDHQGHGCSDGDRGYVEKFQDYVDDLLQFVERCLSHHKCEKTFLLGHSMGGLVAARAVACDPKLFKGLLLSAPAVDVEPAKKSGFAAVAASVLSHFLPKLPVAHLPASGVSKNRQVLYKYLNDPLVYKGGIKARWVHEALITMNLLFEDKELFKTLPLLLLHGDKDTLVPLAASEKLMKAAKTDDKTLHVFTDAFHEILNEDLPKCLAIITPWLKDH